MATGRNNATIAKTLYMSERAVEKHIGSVFQKLGLVDEGEINRRVMAVLAFVEATGSESGRPIPRSAGATGCVASLRRSVGDGRLRSAAVVSSWSWSAAAC